MNCVFGKRIYTGRAILEEGYLVFRGRKILEISKTPKDALLGKCAVPTPAFIDPHSHIGMTKAGGTIHPLFVPPDALDSLQTDDPARQILLQTRWFIRAGMSQQEAIELVTRRNAEIFDIGTVLGTLEKEKWASFACWNQDPFDLSSYPVAVYGEGRPIYPE